MAVPRRSVRRNLDRPAVVRAFRDCERCGLAFPAMMEVGVQVQTVCDPCRVKEIAARGRETQRLRRRAVNGGVEHPRGIATATLGALNEYRVCVDLMSRGVHVFRAVSPACPVDLLAMHLGTIHRVEVKTSVRNSGGSVQRRGHHHADSVDVMAYVLPNGSVVYDPDPFTVPS